MKITRSLLLGAAIMACSGTAGAGEPEGTLDKDQIRKVVRERIVAGARRLRQSVSATAARARPPTTGSSGAPLSTSASAAPGGSASATRPTPTSAS